MPADLTGFPPPPAPSLDGFPPPPHQRAPIPNATFTDTRTGLPVGANGAPVGSGAVLRRPQDPRQLTEQDLIQGRLTGMMRDPNQGSEIELLNEALRRAMSPTTMVETSAAPGFNPSAQAAQDADAAIKGGDVAALQRLLRSTGLDSAPANQRLMDQVRQHQQGQIAEAADAKGRFDEAKAAEAEMVSRVNPVMRPFVSGGRQAGRAFGSLGMRAIGPIIGVPDAADQMNRQDAAISAGQAQAAEQGGWNPTAARTVTGATGSLLQMIATPGGMPAKLAQAGLSQGNQSYTDAIDAGLSTPKALAFAGTMGALEAIPSLIIDKMGGSVLERQLSQPMKAVFLNGLRDGTVQIAKQFGKTMASEQVDELATTIGQQLTSKLAGVDPNALDAKNLQQAIADTMLQTAAMVGAGQAIQVPGEALATRNANRAVDQASKDALDRRTAVDALFAQPAVGQANTSKPQVPAEVLDSLINNLGGSADTMPVVGQTKEGRPIFQEVPNAQAVPITADAGVDPGSVPGAASTLAGTTGTPQASPTDAKIAEFDDLIKRIDQALKQEPAGVNPAPTTEPANANPVQPTQIPTQERTPNGQENDQKGQGQTAPLLTQPEDAAAPSREGQPAAVLANERWTNAEYQRRIAKQDEEVRAKLRGMGLSEEEIKAGKDAQAADQRKFADKSKRRSEYVDRLMADDLDHDVASAIADGRPLKEVLDVYGTQPTLGTYSFADAIRSGVIPSTAEGKARVKKIVDAVALRDSKSDIGAEKATQAIEQPTSSQPGAAQPAADPTGSSPEAAPPSTIQQSLKVAPAPTVKQSLTVGDRVRWTKGALADTQATVVKMVGDRPVLRLDSGKVMNAKGGTSPEVLEKVEAKQPAATQPAQPTQPAPVAQPTPYDYMPDGKNPIGQVQGVNRWRIVDNQGRIVGVADGANYAQALANAQAGRIINPTRHHVPRGENATPAPAPTPAANAGASSPVVPDAQGAPGGAAQNSQPNTGGKPGNAGAGQDRNSAGPGVSGGVVGTDTSIEVPGRDAVPARYEVRELGAIRASHDFRGGAVTRTTGYPDRLQPRDYRAGGDEASKVQRQAGNLRPALLINDAPEATSGPSTITQDGTVINGNSRVMTLQATTPEKMGEYRALLAKKASQFGIDPASIAGMREPVLVRVVQMDPNGKEALEFARQGNVSMTQTQSPVRAAAAQGDLIDDRILQELDTEDQTFSQAVNGPAGREFRQQLLNALPPTSRSQYFDELGGGLTDAGKDLVQNIVLTKLLPIDVVERLREARPGLLRTVEAAARPVVRMLTMPEARGLKTAFTQAIDWMAKHPSITDSKRVADLIDEAGGQRQQTLTGGNEDALSPEARTLLDYTLAEANRPRRFADGLAGAVGFIDNKYRGIFADSMPPIPQGIAEALGVKLAPGAEFAAGKPSEPVQETTPVASRPPEPSPVVANEPAFDATQAEPRPAPANKSDAIISDLGEKIGGARKDTATSTGPRAAKPTDDRPGWERRYTVSQVVSSSNPAEVGKWSVNDTKKTDWLGQAKNKGFFSTKEQAEAAIPGIEAKRTHDTYKVSRGDEAPEYGIVRKVSDTKRKIIKRGFATIEEADRYLNEHPREIIDAETSFGEDVLARPEKVMRQGPERRTGDVKGQDFMDTFGFRGVEFGNWNNQAERQQVMNHAFDAMHDLADSIGIPPRALSLNGDLALAFGARGHGLAGARAHYEPDKAVINLTKMKGAGALAHEWFHALDHYLGRQDGKTAAELKTQPDGTRGFDLGNRTYMASEGTRGERSGVRAELRKAFEHIMQTIKTKAEVYQEDTANAENFVGRARDDLDKMLAKERENMVRPREFGAKKKPATPEQLARWDAAVDALLNSDPLPVEFRAAKPSAPVKRGFGVGFRWSNDHLDALEAIRKEVVGRSGRDSQDHRGPMDQIATALKHYRQRATMLADARGLVEKQRRVPTQYMQDAKEIDQGRATNYWTDPSELGARAFSAFVEDHLKAKGEGSDFLSYGSDNWRYALLSIRPFPEGTERVAINKSIREFLDTIKTEETPQGTTRLYAPENRYEIGHEPDRREQQALPVVVNPESGAAPGKDRDLSRFLQGESVQLAPGQSLSRLVADYSEGRIPAFDVRGSEVHRPEDAAGLFIALRSPFVERLSYLVLDKNRRVIHSGVYSVGDINSTYGPTNKRLAATITRGRDADTVIVSHNHPSGDPTRSTGEHADEGAYRRMAEAFAANGVKFEGIITNGHRFSHFTPSGGWSMLDLPQRAAQLYEKAPFERLNRFVVNGPVAASLAAKRIQTDPGAAIVIGTDPAGGVVGVTALPAGTNVVAAQVAAAKLGASRAIVVLPHTEMNRFVDGMTGRRGGGNGRIVDVVAVRDGAVVESRATMRQSEAEAAFEDRPYPYQDRISRAEWSDPLTPISPLSAPTVPYQPGSGGPTKPPGGSTPAASGASPEDRMDASRGAPPRDDAGKPGIIDSFRRHFVHLDPAQQAEAIRILREYESERDSAAAVSARRIRGFVEGLKPEQAQAFAKHIQLADIARQIEDGDFTGKDGQGRTPEDILDLINADLAKGEADPAVQAAVAKRQAFVREHSRKMVEAGLLQEDVLDDDRYYHRQVLAQMNSPWAGLIGGGVREQTRGFQKERSGGTAADIPFYGENTGRDFNTAYHQAEMEYLSQSMQELAKVNTLAKIREQFDRMPQAKAEAKQRNRDAMDEWYQKIIDAHGGIENIDPGAKTWDARWRQTMAMSQDSLAKLARQSGGHWGGPFEHVFEALAKTKDGQRLDHPEWWPALGWLVRQPGMEVTYQTAKGATVSGEPQMHAGAIFNAIKEREQFTKDTLRSKYQTWKDVAKSEGWDHLVEWQPEKGMQMGQGWVLDDKDVRNALVKAGIDPEAFSENAPDVLPVGEAEARRGLVVYGRKPVWLIPGDIAKQLETFGERLPANPLARRMEIGMRHWKQWILTNPLGVVRYQLNNAIGDLDVALTNPALLKQVVKDRGQLIKDLWNFTQGKKMDPDRQALFEAAEKLGIIDAGVQMAELPDADQLPGMARLFMPQPTTVMGKAKAAITGLIPRYWATSRSLGQFREGVLRVAAARHFYEQIDPTRRRYAGGRKDELDSLYDAWAAARDERQRLEKRMENAPVDPERMAPELKKIGDLKAKERGYRASIAAKLGRELMGDYGNLSTSGQVMRRSLIPFWSWMEINLPRYFRLLKNAPYEGGNGTRTGAGAARRIGATVGLTAGMATRMAVMTAAIYAWNEMMKAALEIKDDEDPNKGAGIGKMMIILYRGKDGKVHGPTAAGAWSDALSWFDLDDSRKHATTFQKGIKEGKTAAALGQVAADMAIAPVNRVAGSLNPVLKESFAQASKRDFFPDVRRPRPIGPRLEHLAGTVGGQEAAKIVQDKAGPGNLLEQAVGIKGRDPRSQASQRVREDVLDWAERKGTPIESYGGEPKERGMAIAQARQAFARGETDRAERWIAEWYDLGGKPTTLRSMETHMLPLAALKPADRTKYLASLDEDGRSDFDAAMGQWRKFWKGDNSDGFIRTALKVYRDRAKAGK
jgi:hypothetical protein